MKELKTNPGTCVCPVDHYGISMHNYIIVKCSQCLIFSGNKVYTILCLDDYVWKLPNDKLFHDNSNSNEF